VSLGEQIEIYAHPADREQSFGYHDLAIEHFNLYVTARLYWDADQDVNALLTDYCKNYYGPAAEAMKSFIIHAEANWMHMSTDAAKIGETFELLAQAKAATDSTSTYGRRIQQIADTMKPLEALRVQRAAASVRPISTIAFSKPSTPVANRSVANRSMETSTRRIGVRCVLQH
jgi:hypothetical protein